MEAVMDLIRAIRARRAEMNVPPSKKAELLIVTDQAGDRISRACTSSSVWPTPATSPSRRPLRRM